MTNTLFRKLVISITTIVAGIVAAAGLAAGDQAERLAMPLELARNQAGAMLMAEEIERQALGVADDVHVAARGAETSAAIAEHEARRSAGGSSRAEETDEPGELARAARLFEAIAETNPDYLQVRLIGAAGEGPEIIRFDRLEAGAPVERIRESELQPKGTRPYVVDTLRLSLGDVYVSPIELNEEHDHVQEPYIPVVRVGTPVAGADGDVVGLVIINVDLRRLFARLARENEGDVYLVSEGQYVVHPEPQRTFGTQLGDPVPFTHDFPTLDGQDLHQVTVTSIPSEDGTRLLTTAPVNWGGPPILLIRSTVAGAAEVAGVTKRLTLFAVAIAVALAIALAFVLSQMVVRPLRQMMIATREIPSAKLPALPTARADELGELARALERMNSEIVRQHALELANSETMHAIFNNAGALLVVGDEGQIAQNNQAAEKLLDPKHQSLTGRTLDEVLVVASSNSNANSPTHFLTQDRTPETIECSAVSDPTRLLEVRSSPITVELDDAPSHLVSIEDITDRRNAQQTRERLAAVVDSSKDAVITMDLQGTITSWNGAARILFGYEASEVVGEPGSLLLPVERRGNETPVLEQTKKSRKLGYVESLRVRKDGTEMSVEVAISPLRDANGAIVGASQIVRDITKRKRQESELRRSNAELEQFAYVASHDLQEPLRMVANYTELLAERYQGKLDARADKYIHYASDGARRMQRLVDDLLTYSRLGSDGKALADVSSADVVRFVNRTLKSRASEAQASFHVGPLPNVHADEGQLTQLFQNLLGNALKFRSPDRACEVSVDASPEGQMWHFRVQDNGIGLDLAFKDRIFEMFQRLHPVGEYEGSGIGLALCKRIVERHGGEIWVESVPTGGTTFHFTLKRSAA